MIGDIVARFTSPVGGVASRFFSTRGARKGISLLFSAISGAVIFLCYLNLFPAFGIGVDVDSSWRFGLNAAMEGGYIFGKDLVFAFGPYGSVYTHEFSQGTDFLTIFGQLFLAAPAAQMVFGGVRSSARPALSVVSVAMVAALFRGSDAMMLFLPALFMFSVAQIRRPELITSGFLWRSTLLLAICLLPLGLLPLVKGSAILSCVVAGVGAAVYFWCRGLRLHSLLSVVLPVLYCVVFWCVAGQPLLALPGYFLSLSMIVAGYTNSMSVWGTSGEVVLYLLASAILLAAFVLNDPRHDRAAFWLRLAAMVTLLFMGFKAGFVRHDPHATIGGAVIAHGAILVLMFEQGVSALATALAFITWAWIDAAYVKTTTNGGFESLSAVVSNFSAGFSERVGSKEPFSSFYRHQQTKLKESCDLPVVRGSVDIYSYGQACLIASGYEWHPRPIFQSYAAYEPQLARMNAEHLERDTRPQNLLVAIEPIDNHLPSLEDGASWPVMANRYRLKGFEKNYAVLQAKPAQPTEALRRELVGEGMGGMGEPIVVPPGGDVYAVVDLKPGLLGRVVSFLFKMPNVMVTVEKSNGARMTYRFVPPMAASEFLISPLVTSSRDFARYLDRDPKLMRRGQVKTFKIEPDGFWGRLMWSGSLNYRLQRIGFERKGGAAPINVISKEFGELGSALAQWKPVSCVGNMDSLNGQPHTPTNIETGDILEIHGWLAVSAKDGVATDATFIAVKDAKGDVHVYATEIRQRPDVGAYFGKQSLNNSGYFATVDVGEMGDAVELGVARMKDGRIELCAPVRSVKIAQ